MKREVIVNKWKLLYKFIPNLLYNIIMSTIETQ